MSHCAACTEEFEDYSRPESDALIHDFRQLIIASGVWGYAVGVARRDWDELIAPSPVSGWFGDPEAFCFRDCVGKMCTFVSEMSAVDKELSLVFDDRPHRTEVNEYIYSQYQSFKPLRGKTSLSGLSFLNSTNFVMLQGADMFSWEFFAHARQLLLTYDDIPRPHAQQFFSTGRFHMGLVDRTTCKRLAGALGCRRRDLPKVLRHLPKLCCARSLSDHV
jgi:hypothetical protein